MYTPKHFEETRLDVLHQMIRRHPLGALVAATPHGLDANHVPFELDAASEGNGLLRCHVARANPVWRSLSAEVETLVIFQGEECYVSPSWYAAKQENGKVVPTWNYIAVHAYGKPRVIHDAPWLRELVETLTNRYEAGRADPWRVSDAPHEYIDKLLQAIVGVEIPIDRLIGKWKVSQNRSAADRQGVAAGLRAEPESNESAMARVIESAER